MRHSSIFYHKWENDLLGFIFHVFSFSFFPPPWPFPSSVSDRRPTPHAAAHPCCTCTKRYAPFLFIIPSRSVVPTIFFANTHAFVVVLFSSLCHTIIIFFYFFFVRHCVCVDIWLSHASSWLADCLFELHAFGKYAIHVNVPAAYFS